MSSSKSNILFGIGSVTNDAHWDVSYRTILESMFANAPSKADRRVDRTRKLLLHAMAALLAERGYDDLTVQDLLDRSGVGRATFYAHFRSKEDLFRASIENMKHGLMRIWIADLESGIVKKGELAFALHFFKHVEAHRGIWRSLVGGDGAAIVDRQFRKIFAEMARHDLETQRDDLPGEAHVQFVVGGLMALVNWWMDGEVSLRSEEVYQHFRQAAIGRASGAAV